MEYREMEARIKAGAVIYKADSNLPDDEAVYLINNYDRWGLALSRPKLCVMHPSIEARFVELCKEQEIDIIRAQEYWDAQAADYKKGEGDGNKAV